MYRCSKAKSACQSTRSLRSAEAKPTMQAEHDSSFSGEEATQSDNGSEHAADPAWTAQEIAALQVCLNGMRHATILQAFADATVTCCGRHRRGA